MLQGQGLLPEEIWPMGCLLVPGWSKILFYYFIMQSVRCIASMRCKRFKFCKAMSELSFQFMHNRFVIKNEPLFVAEREIEVHI